MKLEGTWHVVFDNKKAQKHLERLLVRLMTQFPQHQEQHSCWLAAPSEPPKHQDAVKHSELGAGDS